MAHNEIATPFELAAMQDGNAGLVKLALSARTMRAIQKLTQTYLTLSLADIAAQVGLGSAAEAEQHILRCGTALEGFGQCVNEQKSC